MAIAVAACNPGPDAGANGARNGGADTVTHPRTRAEGHRMSFSKIEYLVAERPETPDTLTIDGAGHARFESFTNWGALERPEIGVYATTLSAGDLDAVSALADPSFKDTPDHGGQVRPGDLFRRVRVTSEAGTVEKLIGTKLPVHADLRIITGILDRIVKGVLEHPLRTLRVELSQAAVDPRGELTAVLGAENRGTEPTDLRSPLDLLSGENGWITVEVWPDKPPSEIASEDVTRASIAKVELVSPPDPAFTSRQTLTLAPRGTMSFRVRAKLEGAKAGPSLVRLLYASFAPPAAGRAPIVGEVVSKPARLDVRGGASR
ncbi:hypothetical protein ACMHYB_00805 [Sorangium sp. So ce1128]